MSDVTPEQRESVIRSVGIDDMKKFSELQLRLAQQVMLERVNSKAADAVRQALDGKEEDLVAAMTMPPFTYVTPAITVMAGCQVKFSTLTNDQWTDALSAVDEFSRHGDPNDVRVSQQLNQLLLAHTLVEFRGKDFGDTRMPENYHELVRVDPKGARDTLVEIRNKRMEALGYLPVPVFQRLVEFYNAFQQTVDSMTHGNALDRALGN